MSAEHFSNGFSQSWQGHRIQPADENQLREAIGRAFDYRGDVTIRLQSGEQIVGYVFDRHEDIPQSFIQIFLSNHPEPRSVLYQDILEVEFSGEDTAFGRSWEDWAKKWQKS
jgi:hypothetical protein